MKLVYPRKNWRVMKQRAMEQIFDQCPRDQSNDIDGRPDYGMQRD